MGIFGNNSYGQETKLDSLDKKSLREKFEKFVMEKGKVDYSYGVPCRVYESGCKDPKKCKYFKNAQVYKDKERKTTTEFVIHFDLNNIRDSIDGRVYDYTYFIYDYNADGLNDKDHFEFTKIDYNYNRDTLPEIAKRLIPVNWGIEVERIGNTNMPFSMISEEKKKKAREDYYYVMREILKQSEK